MDPDFADFLLDESHLDLKQKKVDDADFLEGLKITDNEEEEFLLTVDFEPDTRHHKMQEDNVDFDIPFEITSEDLDLLEAQEKKLVKSTDAKADTTPKRQGIRRISSTTGNKENSLQNGNEVDKLKVDLELYRDRAETLSAELNHQKRQILTKEGEITILRQRLTQLDNEKILMAQKYSELTESKRKNAEKIESKWQKEVETLKTELFFKEQELMSISTSVKRKIPKSSALFNDTSASDNFGSIKNDHPIINLVDSQKTSDAQSQPSPYSLMNDLQIFTSFIQEIDMSWRFSDLKEFDTLDIVKAREFACDEIRKIAFQLESMNSGKALAHGLVKIFERALHFRQPIMLTYVSQLLAQIFDKCGDRIQQGILEIRDANDSVIFFNQICKLLTGRVILDGIPKDIILNQCLIINVVIYQLELKIPEEFKPIINNGFLQWILRYDKFTGKEAKMIGTTLYSLSCDLNMLSAVFLSSSSDKIECMSVLDLLLSQADNLIDSLFPRGRIYRGRFGSQLPLLEDEVERLKKINVTLSLLYSFVHRALGPVTLWMPDNLILAQVIWAIDVIDHDIRTLETSEFLPPKVLIAQEGLLDTIFSGLAASWNAKDIVMPEILRETRIPLLYATQQVSKHLTSFSGAIKSGSALEKIIDREVSDDIKSVYETGLLPRSKTKSQADA